MHFAGNVNIQQSRERVWAFVTNPRAVGRCVPDLEGLEVVNADQFLAQVKAGIGPVRGRFAFDVAWQVRHEPGFGRVIARGKTVGSAVNIDSTIDLTESKDGATLLSWSADVTVNGKIASVGARMLNGYADRQTKQFFDCIRDQLESVAYDETVVRPA
jgi:carbon monoxide dehydrogenase subunit G